MALSALQRTGDSSNKQLVFQPQPKYKPELESLFVTVPSHWAKLVSGIAGPGLEASRQQLVSSFADVEWNDLVAFAQRVHQHKRLQGAPTDAQFLAELTRCQPYHTAARLSLDRN